MESERALSFEETLKRLESLIDRMEDGNLPLEESLKAYEEGMALLKYAREQLDAFRSKIEATVTEEI